MPPEHVEQSPVMYAPDADSVVFAARQEVGRLVKLHAGNGSCNSREGQSDNRTGHAATVHGRRIARKR